MNRILVTGAGGFIGSHLAEACAAEGHKVRAFVRYNSLGRTGWLKDSKFKDDFEIVAGDIRDYDAVEKAVRGCDTVFHLAALIGIPYSYHSPLAYIKTNVEGTYNVLQAARETGADRLVVTSTSEVYGTAERVPIDESHPLSAQSPYAASKIGADQLALSFHRSFGLPVTLARPFNTYGPRQSARAVIPTIITQILAGKREIRLGNLAPVRDFTYVEDTVAGFLAIGKAAGLAGEVTNIGTTEVISVGDLARLIAEIMNETVEIVNESARTRPQESEVGRLVCDAGKLMRLASWRPRHDLKSGLAQTIAWMEKHLSHYDVEAYSV
jgi:dTDP-glucose 4,6-dehydratase